jgi:thioredoxin-like negative regulator of GroEL
LQKKIGEATNLYTFGKFDEAIPIFEEVLKEMPELAEVTHTMSLIYEEKGDLAKAFTFAFLSAIETRTDTEKWK